MRFQRNKDAHVRVATHVPAANTAAVVTIAAEADETWHIETIAFGYVGAVIAAAQDVSITVTNCYGPAGAVTWTYPARFISGTNPSGFIDLSNLGLPANAKNLAMVITLPAGGANVIGTLSVTYR